MRLRVGGIDIEGTPEEVASTLRELRAQGLIGAQTSFAAEQPVVAIVDQRAPAPVARERPTNEALVYEYRNDTGLGKDARRTYVNAVEHFRSQLEPKSLLDADQNDVRAHLQRLLQNCASLEQRPINNGAGLPWSLRLRCREEIYDSTLVKPPSCAMSCPKFTHQKSGPYGRLQALKNFYDFVRDRGLRTDNPVESVRSRYAKQRGPVKKTGNKYAPTLDEARELVRGAREALTPREVAVTLCLAKWGRRPQHTLLIRAPDLLHLSDAGPAWADFQYVKEEMERRNGSPLTKLNGNLASPIDNELRTYLRDVYLPYRRERWGFYPNEGPLFPGKRGNGPMHEDVVKAEVLDPIMRHLRETARTPQDRTLWDEHLDVDHARHISPGCWRHFFSTTLRHFSKIDPADIDVLRGDTIDASRGAYEHWRPEDVCARYHMPDLLAAG